MFIVGVGDGRIMGFHIDNGCSRVNTYGVIVVVDYCWFVLVLFSC